MSKKYRIDGFKLLNAFMRFKKTDSRITAQHTSLWLYLFTECNLRGWVEWMTVNPDIAISNSGVSRNTYYKVLKDLNTIIVNENQKLIDYVPAKNQREFGKVRLNDISAVPNIGTALGTAEPEILTFCIQPYQILTSAVPNFGTPFYSNIDNILKYIIHNYKNELCLSDFEFEFIAKKKDLILNISFKEFSEKYPKGGDKFRAKNFWQQMTDEERSLAFDAIPFYIQDTETKPHYRKKIDKYLEDKYFNDLKVNYVAKKESDQDAIKYLNIGRDDISNS